MHNKKLTTAGILSLLSSLSSIGVNGFVWLIITAFVGLGKSLSGSQENSTSGDFAIVIIASIIVVSFVLFVLSILILAKNKRSTLNNFWLIVYTLILVIVVILNIICIFLTLASGIVIMYVIFALINLLAVIFTIAAIRKTSTNIQ